jgi:hypothetical protein
MRSLIEDRPEPEAIGAVEDAHAFLRAVYQNPDVPLAVRMRAAAIAIEYERPTPSRRGSASAWRRLCEASRSRDKALGKADKSN